MLRQLAAAVLLAGALGFVRESVGLQGNAALLNGMCVGLLVFLFVAVMDSKKEPR